MLGPNYFVRQQSTRSPYYFSRQVLVLILLSTVPLFSQQQSPHEPAAATPATSAAEDKPAQEKPQPKPDESAAATAALLQLNNALEGLAAKVSPAVVQILVTGYGPAHEENRTQTALIVRQQAVGSGRDRRSLRLHHDQRPRSRRRAEHSRCTAAAKRFRPRGPRRQTPHPSSKINRCS